VLWYKDFGVRKDRTNRNL